MLPLNVETWIWYAVVIAVTVCRYISRILALGSLKRFQLDDWIMLVAIGFYTSVIITLNIVANADTNLFPSNFDLSSLTAADIASREYGSKIVLIVEQSQCAAVWATKACMLIMYYRLTLGRMENKLIRALMIYVAIGFVFMEVAYLAIWCRPFHNYWAVPTPNEQCNTAINHLIVNAVCNLSSDLILMAIALPMFLRSHMAMKKKIPLVFIFGLGFFVILCAVLNKYYSFTQPFGSQWTYWYARESSTSILVANLPFLWTLIRRMNSSLGSTQGTSKWTAADTAAGTRLRTITVTKQYTINDPEKVTGYTEHDLLHSDPPSRDGSSLELPAAAAQRVDRDMTFLTSPSWMDRDDDMKMAPGLSKPAPVSRTFERNLHDFHRVPKLRTRDASPQPPLVPRTPPAPGQRISVHKSESTENLRQPE